MEGAGARHTKLREKCVAGAKVPKPRAHTPWWAWGINSWLGTARETIERISLEREAEALWNKPWASAQVSVTIEGLGKSQKQKCPGH